MTIAKRINLITIVASCLLVGVLPAVAQMDGGSGPIDITADQQEFAQDHIVASGNVRVVSGDTTIRAPKATLFRDETGQPKSAIFVGRPRLTQGSNVIIANKLTFDMKSSLIIADGGAHSEVKTSGLGGGGGGASDDKIITDSDRQLYEKSSGKFEAIGNVRVKTGDIKVKSKHLKLVYGTDNEPEAVLFTGNVKAKRDKNLTMADSITYFLTTKRLQATGHVRSRVIQEKKIQADSSGGKKKSKMLDLDNSEGPAEILIISDAQDYNKQTGRVDAEGNVQIYYKDTIGRGPKITVLNDRFGRADKVLFTGRSQITQPGRRWIADKITLTMDDRKVLAEGNTRAIIVKNNDEKENKQMFQLPSKDTLPIARPGAAKLAGRGEIQ